MSLIIHSLMLTVRNELDRYLQLSIRNSGFGVNVELSSKMQCKWEVRLFWQRQFVAIVVLKVLVVILTQFASQVLVESD